ncbi:MAG: GNAT family N-acetyltransferase [Myxococcales bacterium]|nr:GNAT family N-acetyltransferase [Myxococcales bacterium]
MIGLREAGTADIPMLIQAEIECFGEHAWTPSMVREEFERPGGVQWLSIGPDRGLRELQGFAFGWQVVGELHVLHIGTVPAARRVGVGRHLLRRLLDTPGTETAWLEVRADNAAAIGLYAGEGFIDVGRRKRYYPDGGDAVVMRR